MAGKKKDGFGALKTTTGGLRRDDRHVTDKWVFEPITIDAKNALTVVYMLKSPEDNVVLRAVASLEGFARKATENLQMLCSLGIFEYLLPLVQHNDYIIKRFVQKLIGMLSSLEEFRDQMFQVENVLSMFVDILEKETDVVMHEYSALTLAELSSECQGALNLLKVHNCIETLFKRITSPDPDVQKNCLDVMNHLLNDVNGIEAFIESPGFDIKTLLQLTLSSYPVIQILAIHVLKQLTSCCRDPRVLIAFRDARGIETTLNILEKKEWIDLGASCLELLINVVDSPELCDYLLSSGCLLRLITLLDNMEDKTIIEKILGVLARMSQTQRGRMALHAVEMGMRFSLYLQQNVDGIQEASCLGIAYLAQHGPSLKNILSGNPTRNLVAIITDSEKSFTLRNMAAYALNILCNADQKVAESLLENDDFENLFPVLAGNNVLPVELCKNVIQVFVGVSRYDSFRARIITENLIGALLSCISSSSTKGSNVSVTRDSSLQVDALECLSGYLVESEARSIFDELDGASKLIDCLRSKYASVREWAGHLVVLASQSTHFVMSFIRKKGLQRLINEKNTRYSMPSWESAIDAVLSSFLPAKFAYTGRLDLQDITQDGFYIFTHPGTEFFLLEDYIEEQLSPIFAVYIVNFNSNTNIPVSEKGETASIKSTQSERHNQKAAPRHADMKSADSVKLGKIMKGANRNSTEDIAWKGSLLTYPSVDYAGSIKMDFPVTTPLTLISDPYLKEYAENLRYRLQKEEYFFGDTNWNCLHPKLVAERARIIAEFVAEEMSGPEPNFACGCHYKTMFINELKYNLGTNILPLGFIRVGDHLERALLFKVLSDRIGFPCALVRGSYGRYWIEIAIPVINFEDLENIFSEEINSKMSSPTLEGFISKENHVTIEASEILGEPSNIKEPPPSPADDYWFPKVRVDCFKAFPYNFLKTNAIVDLVNKPGRIMKINSPEADEYRGDFLFNK